jgi:ABC-2 type transport system permease protein
MKAFLSTFWAALWAEFLKAKRSKVPLLTTAGFMILPAVTGLFMVILKDPEAAKEMGLISMKAQLTGGAADWPALFEMLKMGTGIAGQILFSIIVAWVFGREFADHTVKDLLALPTPRGTIVAAKFLLVLVWTMAVTLLIFTAGYGIGLMVDIPGLSSDLTLSSFRSNAQIGLLTTLLMPVVALIASAGRNYLPPLGWTFLMMALAQIAAVMGWGEWFPWAVPALLSEFSGPVEPLGLHSYLVVALVFVIGTVSTFLWWQRADQAG